MGIGEEVSAAIAAGGDEFIALAQLFLHLSQNFIPAQVGILGLHPQNADNGLKPHNTTINQCEGSMFEVGGDDQSH